MKITDLLLDNFTILCLAIGLLIIMLTNRNLDEKTNLSFVLFVLLVIVLDIADIMDYYLSGFATPSALHYITSAIGYTLRPASIVIFIAILFRRRKAGIVFFIPVIVVGLIAATSCFTHWMFGFGENNQFIRGPLGYASHVLSGIYLVILVIITIKMHRHITSGEVFAITYIAVVCAVAAAIESVLSGYKFLLTGAMITACAIYYIVLYSETYKRDIMTGLMNRRSLYINARRMRGKPMAVISMDLNGLKDINDSYGHSAGDKAIQSVGKALLVKSGRNFTAYRVGGDEFMALGKEQTDKNVQDYIDDMRSSLKSDGLSASFGCAYYSPDDNFDDICNQADARMYEDKRQYKHRLSTRADRPTE